MNLSDTASLLVKLASAVTAIIVIARAWMWMAETTNSLRRIVALLPKIELITKLEPLVDTLTTEFRRNGGSTLADKVRNIEQNVTKAATKADEAVKANKRQDEVLERQNEMLEKNTTVLTDIQHKVNLLSDLPEENGAED